MDEVTQQNSALVEENAATAKTLEHQARAMDERVAFFRIDGNAAVAQPHAQPGAAEGGCRRAACACAAPKRPAVVTPKRRRGQWRGRWAGRPHAVRARHRDQGRPEWKEF